MYYVWLFLNIITRFSYHTLAILFDTITAGPTDKPRPEVNFFRLIHGAILLAVQFCIAWDVQIHEKASSSRMINDCTRNKKSSSSGFTVASDGEQIKLPTTAATVSVFPGAKMPVAAVDEPGQPGQLDSWNGSIVSSMLVLTVLCCLYNVWSKQSQLT